MTKQYKRSVKIADHLGTAHRIMNRGEALLTCWKLDKRLGIKYTEEQNQKLNEAQRKIYEAKKIVDEVYAEIIGKMMVSEVKKY